MDSSCLERPGTISERKLLSAELRMFEYWRLKGPAVALRNIIDD